MLFKNGNNFGYLTALEWFKKRILRIVLIHEIVWRWEVFETVNSLIRSMHNLITLICQVAFVTLQLQQKRTIPSTQKPRCFLWDEVSRMYFNSLHRKLHFLLLLRLKGWEIPSNFYRIELYKIFSAEIAHIQAWDWRNI